MGAGNERARRQLAYEPVCRNGRLVWRPHLRCLHAANPAMARHSVARSRELDERRSTRR